MKVFISWSGERSKEAANILHWWLPKVIQALEPWVSGRDIQPGASWFEVLRKELSDSQFGVLCLTAENLQAPWLFFEAGAIWKGLPDARPCAYLLGLSPADVSAPLTQFQLTEAKQEDTWKLVLSLNASLGQNRLSEGALKEQFEVWWPKLEDRLAGVLSQQVAPNPRRSDRELLEEILDITRRQSSGPQVTRDTYLLLLKGDEILGNSEWPNAVLHKLIRSSDCLDQSLHQLETSRTREGMVQRSARLRRLNPSRPETSSLDSGPGQDAPSQS